MIVVEQKSPYLQAALGDCELSCDHVQFYFIKNIHYMKKKQTKTEKHGGCWQVGRITYLIKYQVTVVEEWLIRITGQVKTEKVSVD